jgi:hypothetical protein
MRSKSSKVPCTLRLWVAVADPWVEPELVIFATTLYVPAAGKVYVMFGPDPIGVPRRVPSDRNQRQLIVHDGGVSHVPVKVNETGCPSMGADGVKVNSAVGSADAPPAVAKTATRESSRARRSFPAAETGVVGVFMSVRFRRQCLAPRLDDDATGPLLSMRPSATCQ